MIAQMPTPFFTSETARKYALLSHEARAAAKLAKEQDANDSHLASKSLTYHDERLARVRMQLASLDKRVAEMILDASEENAGALDRLCSAQAKLAEQERILSGRPLPGSHRPSKSSSRPTPSAPVGPEPDPE